MSEYEYWDTSTDEGLTEDDLLERYDDFLDEVHGEPMGYPASRILKEVDPIAYRCGFNDWQSSEVENGTITEDEPNEDEDDDNE